MYITDTGNNLHLIDIKGSVLYPLDNLDTYGYAITLIPTV